MEYYDYRNSATGTGGWQKRAKSMNDSKSFSIIDIFRGANVRTHNNFSQQFSSPEIIINNY